MIKKLLSLQKEMDRLIQPTELEMHQIASAMSVECSELWQVIGGPWWRDRQDIPAAKEELIDVLFFWLSLANKLGITQEEVFELYMNKYQKNMERFVF